MANKQNIQSLISASKEKIAADSGLKELLSKSTVDFFLRSFGRVSGYLFVYLIIKWFGPSNFGKWSLALTIFLIIQSVTNLGLKTAMVKFIAHFKKKQQPELIVQVYSKAIIILVFSSTIGTVFLFFGSALLAPIFEKVFLVRILEVLALGILPMNMMALNSGILRGQKKIAHHSFVENIGITLIAILFLITTYAFYEDFIIVSLVYVTSISFLCFWSFILVFKGIKPVFTFSKGYPVKDILELSIPMFFTTTTNMIKNWSDIIILGLFCSNLQVGAYSLAIRLSKIISMPLKSVNTIAGSQISELHAAENKIKLKKSAIRATKLIFLTSFPLIIGLVFFNNYIISFFNNKYLFITSSLIVLAFGQFFNAISGSVGQILNMTDNQKVLMYISISTSVLNIALNFWLIPHYNVLGAAIATTFTLVLANILALFFIYKRLHFFPVYIPFINSFNNK